MSKILLPVSAIAIYRTVSSRGEVLVPTPSVIITKANGDIKTLYDDRTRSRIVDNPFVATNSGQWQVWTEPELEPVIIRIRKGRAESEISYTLTPTNEMIISDILPVIEGEEGMQNEGVEAQYIGQDYLYQFTDQTTQEVTERLFKARSTTIGDWIEINIGVA